MVSVADLIEHFSYLAILVMLVVAGLGMPFPEELVLLSSGLLASHGTLTFWKALASCYLGVVLGDSLIYLVGSRLGIRVFEHPFFKRLFTPRLVAFLERHFRRHGVLTVIAARHLAGVRAPTFLVAGMTGLRFWKFALADSLSAMVTVPLSVWIGFHFGSQLPRVLGVLKRVHHATALILLAIAVVVAAVVLARRRARERRGEPDLAIHELERELLRPPPVRRQG